MTPKRNVKLIMINDKLIFIMLCAHRVEEWDVCNEELHQHFFEDATNYRELLIEEFKKAHSIDPKSLLFLNDYQITRDGQLTSVSSTNHNIVVL